MSPIPRFLKTAERWMNKNAPGEREPHWILPIIRGGESETVEFKTNLPSGDLVAKVLAAFANTNGGILILGVGDKGEVLGLSDNSAETAIDRLNHITSSLFPYSIDIGYVEISGKILVFAKVPAAPKEFAPITTSRGEYYQRCADSTVSAKLEDAWLDKRSIPSKNGQRQVQIFVAMSFRDEEEPALVDYFKAMEKAAVSTALPITLTRIDLEEGDYEISQKIMEKIDDCEILIADFTLSSRNVYFELGYARGRGCRVIQTARTGTNLEFDTRNWRTQFYRNATELEEKLAPALKAAYADAINSKGQQSP